MLAVAVLGACSSEPRVASATPPGVSYRFTGDNMSEANLRANRYCAQYGKRAVLEDVTRGSTDNVAAYQCS
jgi:hypothetical protein